MTTTYQSQQTSEPSSPTYYVSDYSKFSLSELWLQTTLKPSRLIYLTKLLIAKMAGRPVRMGVPSLNHNRKRIELGEIPETIKRDLDPIIRSFQSAGYTARLVHTATRSKGNSGYGVHLVGADRLSAAGIVWVRVLVGGKTKTEVATAISTHRQNGEVLVTTNAPPRIKSPPEMRVHRLVGATTDQLVARHRKRILNCTDAIVVDESNLAARVAAQARRIEEFHVTRGIHVPANSEEMIRYRDQMIAPGDFETTSS